MVAGLGPVPRGLIARQSRCPAGMPSERGGPGLPPPVPAGAARTAAGTALGRKGPAAGGERDQTPGGEAKRRAPRGRAVEGSVPAASGASGRGLGLLRAAEHTGAGPLPEAAREESWWGRSDETFSCSGSADSSALIQIHRYSSTFFFFLFPFPRKVLISPHYLSLPRRFLCPR